LRSERTQFKNIKEAKTHYSTIIL